MGKKKTLSDHCSECGARCCRYVATEIDKPTCKRDFDNLRWYLLHQNVHVFITPENDWYLEFETPCSALGDCGKCLNYGTRPRICREHGEETVTECEFLGEKSPYKMRFSTSGEFERWLDKQKIDWRWKKLRG